ncbi:MAG: helix-turn-helix domain-containing protein [Clostridia bacterium]|nr:helix-turn-helix domain-containing protein [Clostridia bacterium]
MSREPVIQNKSIDELYKAIVSINSVEECYTFFEDLCTITEIQAMAQRYHVALMLEQGVTYSKIAKETGASSATISRVNRALNYGAGGYKSVITKVEK